MNRFAKVLPLLGLLAPALQAQERPAASTLPEDASQHVVVITEEPDAIQGRLFRVERSAEGWRTLGGPVPVVVGRNGVGPKREGDGRSPRGIFQLGQAFGYASMGPEELRIPYRSLAPGTVCVDDPTSPHYNRIVDPGRLPQGESWESAEAMRRDLVHGDDLYRWGVEVLYNPEQKPGAGSCIFLHVWRGPGSPTVGCTAMPQEELLTLLHWLKPEGAPILIQGTQSFLEALRREGILPYSVPGV